MEDGSLSSKEKEDNIMVRTSNASTFDSEFSEEEERKLFKERYSLSDLKLHPEVFINLSPELETMYLCLSSSLKHVLLSLESELEPVNIREEKVISGCSINLATISMSRISKRRSTLELSKVFLP